MEKLETVNTVQSDGANTVTEDSRGKRTPNSSNVSCNIYPIDSFNMTIGRSQMWHDKLPVVWFGSSVMLYFKYIMYKMGLVTGVAEGIDISNAGNTATVSFSYSSITCARNFCVPVWLLHAISSSQIMLLMFLNNDNGYQLMLRIINNGQN